MLSSHRSNRSPPPSMLFAASEAQKESGRAYTGDDQVARFAGTKTEEHGHYMDISSVLDSSNVDKAKGVAVWALPLAALPRPALAAEDIANAAGEISKFSPSSVSQASYYTTLALFILSFPGVYSLIKRSVKAKVVRKTYEVLGPGSEGGRPTRELAGDIVAFFQANNYKIKDAGEVITFEGLQSPVRGRAAFLTFVAFMSLGAFALVLSIAEQGVFGEGNGLGNLWYLSLLASPLAGKFYNDNAERTDEITVKISVEEDETTAEVVVQGNDEEVDRLRSALDLREKDMIYIKGLLED